MFAKYPTQRGNWLLSVPLFNPWRIASFISFEIYQICKLKLLFHPQIKMKFTPNVKGKKLPEPNHLNCLLVFTSLKHFCLSFFWGEFFGCTHETRCRTIWVETEMLTMLTTPPTIPWMPYIRILTTRMNTVECSSATYMWSPLCDYCHQTSVAVDAVTLLLLLLLHRRIIKCKCTLFTLQMLAFIQRIDMDHILRMFRLLAT